MKCTIFSLGLGLLIMTAYAQTKTYSISSKTSRYTQCFKEFVDSLDNIYAYRLNKIFYTLDDVRNALLRENHRKWGDTNRYKHYTPGFDTSLRIKARVINEIDKKYITGILNKITRHIYSITVNQEFPSLKEKVAIFTCRVAGKGMNITAPKKEDWYLPVPGEVLRSMHKRSLVDIFLRIDSLSMHSFSGEDLENAESPLEYLSRVNSNKTYYPPCLPILRKADFLALLNDTSLRKPTLKQDDLEVLDRVKEMVSADDFYGELLCNCFYSSQYTRALLAGVDLKKLPPDLLAVVKKADKNKDIDEDFIEGYYEDWMKRQVNTAVISNEVSMEILKYLVFAIAHECYHAWFAYGLIGKPHELNADAYATFIYLKVFTDKKIIHDFVQKLNFSMHEVSTDTPAGEFTEYEMDNLLRSYIGRSIVEIFQEVLKKNAFYERTGPYHPPFAERIAAISAIIGDSMESEDVLVKLKSKLVTIFSNQ